ncbi:MAG: hypothetical protein EZS28_020001 [Streblomastix strix]|uniref:Uncharacterized protein n=1 Tax=Streblomastix strix TaxID=222440 RepID=A0A5J4VPJ2_9EUKA|nr:MAG: hypothetical protein EZS28_020001 [Streblomastix strix]
MGNETAKPEDPQSSSKEKAIISSSEKAQDRNSPSLPPDTKIERDGQRVDKKLFAGAGGTAETKTGSPSSAQSSRLNSRTPSPSPSVKPKGSSQSPSAKPKEQTSPSAKTKEQTQIKSPHDNSSPHPTSPAHTQPKKQTSPVPFITLHQQGQTQQQGPNLSKPTSQQPTPKSPTSQVQNNQQQNQASLHPQTQTKQQQQQQQPQQPHPQQKVPAQKPPMLEVTFIWKHGAVKDVFISGSFNRWQNKIPLMPQIQPNDINGPSQADIDAGGMTHEAIRNAIQNYGGSTAINQTTGKPYQWIRRWAITLRIPPGQYYFKYIVDGQWQHDRLFQSGPDPNGNIVNILNVTLPAQLQHHVLQQQQQREQGQAQDHQQQNAHNPANNTGVKPNQGINQPVQNKAGTDVGGQNAINQQQQDGSMKQQKTNLNPQTHQGQQANPDAQDNSATSTTPTQIINSTTTNNNNTTMIERSAAVVSAQQSLQNSATPRGTDFGQIQLGPEYFSTQPPPQILPPLLHPVLLQYERTQPNMDPFLMPIPEHVTINHIYFSKHNRSSAIKKNANVNKNIQEQQKDPNEKVEDEKKENEKDKSKELLRSQTQLVGVTQRFRRKVSTIVLYMVPTVHVDEKEKKAAIRSMELLSKLSPHDYMSLSNNSQSSIASSLSKLAKEQSMKELSQHSSPITSTQSSEQQNKSSSSSSSLSSSEHNNSQTQQNLQLEQQSTNTSQSSGSNQTQLIQTPYSNSDTIHTSQSTDPSPANSPTTLHGHDNYSDPGETRQIHIVGGESHKPAESSNAQNEQYKIEDRMLPMQKDIEERIEQDDHNYDDEEDEHERDKENEALQKEEERKLQNLLHKLQSSDNIKEIENEQEKKKNQKEQEKEIEQPKEEDKVKLDGKEYEQKVQMEKNVQDGKDLINVEDVQKYPEKNNEQEKQIDFVENQEKEENLKIDDKDSEQENNKQLDITNNTGIEQDTKISQTNNDQNRKDEQNIESDQIAAKEEIKENEDKENDKISEEQGEDNKTSNVSQRDESDEQSNQ